MGPSATPTGMGSLTRLRELRPRLAEAERRLATYILRHPRQVLDSSITLVAGRARVSEATVVRLCRRIGCRGYQDLRIRLAADLVVPPRQLYHDIETTDDGPAVKHKVFGLSMRALEETLDVLDDTALERAAAAVAAARRVDFYGVGASGIVALDAQQKFLRIGIAAQAFVDPHVQALSAALLRRGDVAVGVSDSGSTRDTVHALGVARAAGAVTIAITRYGPSPIDKAAAIRLHTLSPEGGIRGGALASRIAQLAVVDALLMMVALRRYDVTLTALRATRDAVAGEEVLMAGVRVGALREADLQACARLVAEDPLWRRYGVSRARARRLLRGTLAPRRGAAARAAGEVAVARAGGEVLGFVWFHRTGTFAHSGYIRWIAVAPGSRGAGVGRALMAHAERRILAAGPNVFLLVSDVNAAARAFYRRLGYAEVGAIPDYVVPGITERLLRKTTGPIEGGRLS